MSRALSLLYRGPLASCNYACPYCPFAKRVDDRAAQRKDQRSLERLVAWARQRADLELSILFTPWGEALVRRWYRDAMVTLSQLGHVTRVVAQTNLSGPLDWVGDADLGALALWVTYHPGETTRARFLARCQELLARGVRFSVGVVGLPAHLGEAEALRAALPEAVYLWINAVKDLEGGYPDEIWARFRAIDPLVDWNARPHPSRGRACRTGEAVLAVDGDGNLRRCHFVEPVLGNLYAPGAPESVLAPRVCPATSCRCHIGYVHMPELGLLETFAGGVLERIPAAWGARGPWIPT